MKLYGEWQTQPWSPPPVVDGKLPRNEYGNWEVWTESHIPSGAKLLSVPNIHKAASCVGIDFVRAVVGFKREGPSAVPIFTGILVASGMARVTMDAYEMLLQGQAEKEIKKRNHRVVARWRRLTQLIIMKDKVDRRWDIAKQ